eukprot:gene15225-18016_t
MFKRFKSKIGLVPDDDDYTRVSRYFQEVTFDYFNPENPFVLPSLCPPEQPSQGTTLQLETTTPLENNNVIPRLPVVIWRDILNLIVYRHFTPVGALLAVDKKNNFSSFLKLSLVCREWARDVLPYLHYGRVDITNEAEMGAFFRLSSEGIYKRPFRFRSLNLAFTQMVDRDCARLITQVSLVINQLDLLKISFHVADNTCLKGRIGRLIQTCKVNELDYNYRNSFPYPNAAIAPHELISCSTLTIIDLGHNRFGPDLIKRIAPLLGIDSQVVSLNLENNGLKEAGIKALARLLRCNSSITNLNLSFNLALDSVVDLVDSLVQANNTVTALDLNENGIGHVGGTALATLIRHPSSIRSLNIGTNLFGAPALEMILVALSTNQSITDLSLALAGTHLDARLLRLLVSENKSIARLNLMVNDLGEHGTGFFYALANNSAIDSLNLSYTKVKGPAKKALETAILSNRTIRRLNLSYGFVENDTKGITLAIASNTTITELDLSLNSIDSVEGEFLARALSTNTALTSLNLGGNIISVGAIPILRALNNNKTLTYLNLRKNQIGTVPPRVLFDVLTKNSTLRHLDLYQNFLDNAAGREIASGIAYNASLTHLDVSFNHFEQETGLILSETLAYVPTLRHLNVSGNRFGVEIAALLKEKYTGTFTSFVLENDSGKPKPVQERVPTMQPITKFTKKFFFLVLTSATAVLVAMLLYRNGTKLLSKDSSLSSSSLRF